MGHACHWDGLRKPWEGSFLKVPTDVVKAREHSRCRKKHKEWNMYEKKLIGNEASEDTKSITVRVGM